jgi:hypothetical protein
LTVSARGRAVLVLLAAAAISACAPSAVVVVSPAYDPARVKAVALTSFADFPGAPGSGDAAANTFEKYLLQAGYRIIDPVSAQASGRPLAADALAIGALTDYSGARDETVMVDMPQTQTDPVYGRVVTTQRSGDTRVRTTQTVVTGYAITQTDAVVPQTQTVPAHVALNVRLVDAKTSELLWSVSSGASDDDLASATEAASASAMQAVLKKLKSVKPQ